MKQFHCEMFELSIRLRPDELEEPKLLEAMGIDDKAAVVDEDGDLAIARTFGRREETTDHHGHIRILLRKAGDSKVDLRFHADSVDIEEEEPPHVEDCAQWLAKFIKKEEVTARINAAYVFDKFFAPTIALPFPLATSEKPLAGASVTGVSIQFPDSEQLAVVQRGVDETYVSMFTQSNVRLADFALSAQLEKLEVSVDSLVRKQE